MKFNLTASFLAIFIASIISVSCGNKKSPDVSIVTPKEINVKGDLGDYFEVVSRDYKIEKANDVALKDDLLPGIIIVEVKRNDKEFIFPKDKVLEYGEGSDKLYYNIGFGLEVYGNNGPEEVISAEPNSMMFNNNKEAYALINLKKGEKGFIKFRIDKWHNAKKFQLTSSLKKNEASESSNTNVTSDTDCDKFIQEYRAFANSYIKLLRKYKANPSNPNILNEYSDASQKASEMQSEASNCTDIKYAAELMEIANKIAREAF